MTDFEKGAEAMRVIAAAKIDAFREFIAQTSNIDGLGMGDRRSEDLLQNAAERIRSIPLPVQPPGSESREARLLRTLVDSDCEIEISHANGCAGSPPERLDGKCPGCMWIRAASETREALGLPGMVRDIVPSRLARPPSPEKQRGDKT